MATSSDGGASNGAAGDGGGALPSWLRAPGVPSAVPQPSASAIRDAEASYHAAVEARRHAERDGLPSRMQAALAKREAEAKTDLEALGGGGLALRLGGLVAVSDVLKPEASAVVAALRRSYGDVWLNGLT